MNITDIRIFPVNDVKLKAFVTITIDGCFLISGIKIIEGTSGYFLSMPSKKRKDGTFKDIAHPINSDTRKRLEEQVFAKYEETPKPAVREQRQAAEGEGHERPEEFLESPAPSELSPENDG